MGLRGLYSKFGKFCFLDSFLICCCRIRLWKSRIANCKPLRNARIKVQILQSAALEKALARSL